MASVVSVRLEPEPRTRICRKSQRQEGLHRCGPSTLLAAPSTRHPDTTIPHRSLSRLVGVDMLPRTHLPAPVRQWRQSPPGGRSGQRPGEALCEFGMTPKGEEFACLRALDQLDVSRNVRAEYRRRHREGFRNRETKCLDVTGADAY